MISILLLIVFALQYSAHIFSLPAQNSFVMWGSLVILVLLDVIEFIGSVDLEFIEDE